MLQSASNLDMLSEDEAKPRRRFHKLPSRIPELSIDRGILVLMLANFGSYRNLRIGTNGTLDHPLILRGELEASASSGRAGAMGETTGHATGHATGSGSCRLL
jgi:hypothetical protein